jgi:hypothetical protein
LKEYQDASFIIFEDGICMFREGSPSQLSLDSLLIIKDEIKRDRNKMEGFYRLEKIKIASIYGCIGVVNVFLAAAITCLLRSTLLETCSYLIHEHDCIVYYCDTDSLFVKSKKKEQFNMSNILNEKFTHTEIEMKQVKRVMFVGPKTYYIEYDNESRMKYGQHVNGPLLWREAIFKLYYEWDTIRTTEDIEKAFESIYTLAYDRSQMDMNQITQQILIQDSYKTMTPSAELLEYLKSHNLYDEVRKKRKRLQIYYKLISNNITKTAYMLFDKNVNLSIREVNLFKFFMNVFKTMANIIQFHLKRNNHPYYIEVSERHLKMIMLRAFLIFRERL